MKEIDISLIVKSGIKIWGQQPMPDVRQPNRKEIRKLGLTTAQLNCDEEFCSECKGTGVLVYCTKKRFNKNKRLTCWKCQGKGKFDWVDVILNKNKICVIVDNLKGVLL